SHTPHINSLGVIAIGVGGLEAETVMLGRPSMMRMPNIVGVKIVGQRKEGITATDIVLAITEYLRESKVVSAYLEFFGEGVKNLSIGDRATISNMTPEYGATASMFYIDEQTLDYLKMTGREPAQIKLVETYAKQTGLWAEQLAGVEYHRVLEFDLSSVSRNVAGPSTPHSRIATKDLVNKGLAPISQKINDVEKGNKLPDGAVIIAAITSCTNTSNPRNVIAAGLLARNANKLGLTKKAWVKSSFAPGSKVAELYLQQAGLLTEMETLGFGIVGFACTTCNGMSGALDPEIQQKVIQQNVNTSAVLSGNRNFDGRIHPYVKQAFLASPPLVIAYAIAGTVRFDIENHILGTGPKGENITLKDIWPSDSEIDELVNTCVKPKHFQKVYTPMFDIASFEPAESPLYNWRPSSTYIRKPPYWQGALAQKRNMQNMRALAILGDNITTDHLSPSNAIMLDSAAGEYLHKMGLKEEDFNSYATHRGDHHTAQRATFANPKLINEMVVENGLVKQGSFARLEPESKIMRMWETIETYMQRKQPLIIIAGADYGQGSSRDWAAKGVRLAGVEVIVAESFERIHRTNLVGMGILPLAFPPGISRKTLGLTGSETFNVSGNCLAGETMLLNFVRENGESVEVHMTCRLDTDDEVKVYKAGGVLQGFAKDFLASNPH
ncbi:aconitate hydratase AcnA, partial [Paraglaciecola sp.]|uniref:aconitate hydratase AcnA n=1 Tax=Paraglaciecola sp. TaxID=1920173 RepID=UPI003EF65F92